MKPVVIYYSYSNNTRRIAKHIGERLNCDVFELEPAVPYSSVYEEVVELGEHEETKNVLPELKEYPNLDRYDTVVICTPTWWHTLAPVILAYLKHDSLVGKDIYCLTTNGGYGNGECQRDINILCAKSNIVSVLDVPFDEDELEIRRETVEEWISNIR